MILEITPHAKARMVEKRVSMSMLKKAFEKGRFITWKVGARAGRRIWEGDNGVMASIDGRKVVTVFWRNPTHRQAYSCPKCEVNHSLKSKIGHSHLPYLEAELAKPGVEKVMSEKEVREVLLRHLGKNPYMWIVQLQDPYTKEWGDYYFASTKGEAEEVADLVKSAGRKQGIRIIRQFSRTKLAGRNPTNLYSSFHGSPPAHARRVSLPRPTGKLIAIGRISQINYVPYGSSKRKGQEFFHVMGDDGNKVHRERPILAVSEDGKDFFIVKDGAGTHFTNRGIIR